MPRYARRPAGYTAGGKSRRSTEWISATVDWTDFTAAQARTTLSFSQAELRDFVPCTIVRTVGLLAVSADFDFITNQSFLGASGACLVRDDARIAGALPEAFGEAGNDIWWWHQFFAMQVESSSGVDLKLSETYMVDSKAQRKVVDGDAIVFMSQGGGGSDGFDLSLMVRILLKLH